jgi:RibD C-terminal domain
VPQALLQAGQLDELEIHMVSVLLGAGRRLFGDRTSNHIQLELVRRLQGRDATHLRYLVRREGIRDRPHASEGVGGPGSGKSSVEV